MKTTLESKTREPILHFSNSVTLDLNGSTRPDPDGVVFCIEWYRNIKVGSKLSQKGFSISCYMLDSRQHLHAVVTENGRKNLVRANVEQTRFVVVFTYRNSEYTGRNPTASCGFCPVLLTLKGYSGTSTSGPGNGDHPLARSTGSSITAGYAGSGGGYILGRRPARFAYLDFAGCFLKRRFICLLECFHRTAPPAAKFDVATNGRGGT